ncbi:isocitrate/isopropylmalate dehydrogenase family protein [Chloroflexi bacterium TSY]|nr:isocitrate/isopropylmalate dehydrogenase family protein [Chloroflexi bacterium TSY]
MTHYKIGVLPGDGIGPEVVKAIIPLLQTAVDTTPSIDVEWLWLPIGLSAIQSTGSPILESTVDALTTCHGWILGPHDSVSYPPEFQNQVSPSSHLRIHFDLYANIRPARTLPHVQSLVDKMDLVIARENTEGFYADRNMHRGIGEFMPTPDVALVTGVFTRQAIERIAHTACRLAQGRTKHVTIVHKANVIKVAHGLLLETCREVAAQYANLKVDDYHIDAMAALLVRHPQEFDVIIATNMFGDILSDLTAELMGSLGLGSSLNAGDHHAMAQAVHGAAPDIAGQGIANPVGVLHSATMLFEWLSQRHGDEALSKLANRVNEAIEATLAAGVATPDLRGNATTAEFAQAIVQRL